MSKIKTILISVICITSLIFGMVIVNATSEKIIIRVDDKELENIIPKPKIKNGVLFGPIKFIMDKTLQEANWNEKTKTVTFGGLYDHVVGTNYITNNRSNAKIDIGEKSYIESGRLMVDLKKFATGKGYYNIWDEKTKTFDMYTYKEADPNYIIIPRGTDVETNYINDSKPKELNMIDFGTSSWKDEYREDYENLNNVLIAHVIIERAFEVRLPLEFIKKYVGGDSLENIVTMYTKGEMGPDYEYHPFEPSGLSRQYYDIFSYLIDRDNNIYEVTFSVKNKDGKSDIDIKKYYKKLPNGTFDNVLYKAK